MAAMVGWLYGCGAPLAIKLVILDMDGTLIDFDKTWMRAYRETARRVALEAGEKDLEPALLKVGGWVDGRISPHALMLHATTVELAQAWIDTQPIVAAHYDSDAAALTKFIDSVLFECTVEDVTPLGNVEPVLRGLRAAGMQLAVVTNDSKELALAHLRKLGWGDLFVAVIGCDSGHGAKPESGGTRWARLFEAAAGARALTSTCADPTPRCARCHGGGGRRCEIRDHGGRLRMRHGGGPLCRVRPLYVTTQPPHPCARLTAIPVTFYAHTGVCSPSQYTRTASRCPRGWRQPHAACRRSLSCRRRSRRRGAMRSVRRWAMAVATARRQERGGSRATCRMRKRRLQRQLPRRPRWTRGSDRLWMGSPHERSTETS